MRSFLIKMWSRKRDFTQDWVCFFLYFELLTTAYGLSIFIDRNGIFFTKIVLIYCEKKLFQWSRNFFEIQGWRLRICKSFEITNSEQWKARTMFGNSERSEQFLVTECFFNLFLEVSNIWKFRTIIVQIGKNYRDLEICRKS